MCLVVLLMRKFALGKLSAIEVQEVAMAAVKSGLESPEMKELQALGALGHQPGNAHRDLMRKYLECEVLHDGERGGAPSEQRD